MIVVVVAVAVVFRRNKTTYFTVLKLQASADNAFRHHEQQLFDSQREVTQQVTFSTVEPFILCNNKVYFDSRNPLTSIVCLPHCRLRQVQLIFGATCGHRADNCQELRPVPYTCDRTASSVDVCVISGRDDDKLLLVMVS